MSKTYFSYLPSSVGSIEEELRQCLVQAAESCTAGLVPLRFNIYADLPDFAAFVDTRAQILKIVNTFFADSCPAVNITVHPPEKPWTVSLEAAFVKPSGEKVFHRKLREFTYSVIESDAGKELWAGGLSTYNYPDETRKAATGAFDLMVELLNEENMTLNNLVRQWNYIGDILATKKDFQNYQVFNEVRSEYYGKFRTAGSYPAATGVGMKHGGVILDFCAIAGTGKEIIQPVHNPNQVDAYNYGQQVLKGTPEKGKSIKHPPQFERALLLLYNSESRLLISGTASIIGQETIGKGNVEEQTLVTIENINKLADLQRINEYPGIPLFQSRKFLIIRVYVKDQSSFDLARKICKGHFPDVPAVFIEADICRDDLLIEIEAEAEFRH